MGPEILHIAHRAFRFNLNCTIFQIFFLGYPLEMQHKDILEKYITKTEIIAFHKTERVGSTVKTQQQ